ncbi:MAG: SAM-dependent methyltransferase, partial [Arenibacter sp.]|nr:SAM-dependent methyltransferase [Arenibacter sp.]
LDLSDFDLILEQTFFCALDPDLRPQYVHKMKQLLKPTGKLVGLLFTFPLTESGPPYGGSPEEYKALFGDHFNFKVLEVAYNSIKPRANKELFFIFEPK